MKKTLYIFISAILSLSICSCDLDTMPTNSVAADLALANAENAEKVLNGTWSYLMDTYQSYANPGWSCVLLNSDAMGNDVAMQPGKYGYLTAYRFNSMNQPGATAAWSPWWFAYKTIDNCNGIITTIDNLDGDATLKQRVKAQALALRGYMYFSLATHYQFNYQVNPNAKCVPIYTTPTTGESEPQPQSTVQEVYIRASTDLTDAYTLFDGMTYTRDKKHKIDKEVVAGILARLYLTKGDEWVNAEKYAGLAQAKTKWMSKEAYHAGFNDNTNDEWIWGHGQQPDQDQASYSFHFRDVVSSAAYYYSFMADPYFKDFFIKEITPAPANDTIYDTGDTRYDLFEWDVARFKGGLMYKKFLFRSNMTGDIVLMRKAEMVLIQAEALAEQGQLTPAIAKLNELRTERGAATPDLSSLSKQDLIEEILIERRKELWGEGFSLTDILRRQKAVERKVYPTTHLHINGVPQYTDKDKTTKMYIQGHTTVKKPDGSNFSVNDPIYLFVIPNNEINYNPNIQ